MRIFIRKVRAFDWKYTLLSERRAFGANMFLHCNTYDYGEYSHKAPLPANKYPCGLKNFAMGLGQKQSNGI